MNKIVFSSELGDLRKKDQENKESRLKNNDEVTLHLKRLTSGKGRTIIEITNLPSDKTWCKKLAKDLKKKLAVGGAYKSNFIELHGEKMEAVFSFLDSNNIKYKKVGG